MEYLVHNNGYKKTSDSWTIGLKIWSINEDTTKQDSFAKKNEEISSIRFLLGKMISDRVANKQLKNRYESKVEEYSKLMSELVSELKFYRT